MPTERSTPLDPPVEYHRLRDDQPVTRVRFPSGHAGWLVSRFEEGSAVFADPRLSAYRPRHDVAPEEATAGVPYDPDAPIVMFDEKIDPTFVSMNEPDHGQYRRLLTGRFTPKSVQAVLQPYIDRIVTEHLDAIAAGPKPVDLVEALALPIPCLVVCELLGVSYADRDAFHRATDIMMDTSRSHSERRSGSTWLIEHITSLVASIRANPDSTGLLADLVRTAETDGSI